MPLIGPPMKMPSCCLTKQIQYWGKRMSVVTQGVDAEINLTRSTMLKELERFEGVCIFATNFVANYDAAFRRRISHHIKFDIPEPDTLRRLWEYHLVPQIPLKEDREDILDELIEWTEGFTGGEVLMCLRIALPSVFRTSPKDPRLGLNNLRLAVERVKQAKAEVGTYADDSTRPASIQLIREMYGIKDPNDQAQEHNEAQE